MSGFVSGLAEAMRIRSLAVGAILRVGGPAAVRYVRRRRRVRWAFERQIVMLANRYGRTYDVRFDAQARWGGRFAGTTRDMIQRYIYLFGAWEPNVTAWIQRRLKPGDTFIDVGANIGYYSILASQLVGPTGEVISIDPAPTIFAELLGNIARNGATNVSPLNVAVSDRAERLRLYRGPDTNLGMTTTVHIDGLSPDGEIGARPLSELIEPARFARARLVKIDVEGAEAAVLFGMVPLLDRGRSDLEIIVEVDPTRPSHRGSTQEALSLFGRAGFRAYEIENDYRWETQLAWTYRRPQVLTRAIQGQVEVILSRCGPEAIG